MFFVLQTANVTADAKNCVYSNRKEITSGDELKEAVRFDHVCGEFKKNYRNISSLCDIVKMAKVKDEEAVVGYSAAAFSVEERRWADAEETEEAVCLSGLSKPDGREILSGAPEQGEQRL